jgi:UTP--glucose-1-phosphate uridylyltransferase
MSIKKAIFVVAGFGTRFLPATKAQPKEMLPVVDKPIIQYLVEEASAAGIQEIIFVTGRGKNSIENHFDRSFELEHALKEKGKNDKLQEVERITTLANFAYVRQPVQNGDGDALLCAKPFIDPNESVLVIYPDYLMRKETKAIHKIIDIYNQHLEPVICGDVVPKQDVDKYGVMDFEATENPEIVKVKGFIEKPKPNEAPSNLISAGYFVITPEVIRILESSKSTSSDGELRLADAFVTLTQQGKPIYALKPEKSGFDCGNILGFLKATIEFGLEREDLKDDLKKFLEEKVGELNS